jgi:hypothetical protein
MLFAVSFSTCYMVCKGTAWILIGLRGYAGWSGSMLVANALCWFWFYYYYCIKIKHNEFINQDIPGEAPM